MTKLRKGSIAAAGVLALLLSARAAADPASPAPAAQKPPVHLLSPSTVKTDGGSELRLPPSYCLDEPAWDRLGLEVKSLQTDKVRLRAENESLKKSAGGSSWFGWKSVTSALLLGLAAGYWLAE